MLGYLPAMILQCIGVIIPVVGILVLVRKGQGKENMFLVMANFGALIMNWGYLQLLRSSGYQEAISVYKFEYIGTVLFYIFFVLFLNSYFRKNRKSKPFAIIIIVFFALEICSLGGVIVDNELAYNTVKVQYREDDGKFYTGSYDGEYLSNTSIVDSVIDETTINSKSIESTTSLNVDDNESTAIDSTSAMNSIQNIDKDSIIDNISMRGYIRVSLTYGPLLIVRFSFLSVLLLLALCYSIYSAIKNKTKEDRKKIIILIIAEIIVLSSLLYSIFGTATFNITPLLVSLSIMGIICGTASGNFFTLADRGRGWVLDHSENIFVIVDKEYRFVDANGFAKKMFPEIRNLCFHQYIPTELKHTFMCIDSDFEYEDKRYAKQMAPREEKGHILGYCIMFIDMTSHYNLLNQLEEEKQKAIDANNAKSNFMSNMSHEIRTPMNAIVGMTEIMLRHEQDDFNKEYLNNIKNSGNALLTVVNDILDFSKIESGKLEIIPEEYEIMSVLNDLSMIFLNRIGDKPLELIYDIDPELPVKMYGDSNRIRQVLLNIVNNGIKYSDEGHVKLSIYMEKIGNDEIMLNCSVEDTGIGIKEEDLPKLFETFSQVDTKKNRGKEGTGLGLSIAKQLVEAMDGSFTVSSEYGVGSTFSFNMKQRVVDDTKAAIIKANNPVFVTGVMEYEESDKMLKKLCNSFENVVFVEPDSVLNSSCEKLDYIFMDQDYACRYDISEKNFNDIEKYNAEIIVINNPMKNNCEQDGATLINKPLYTLNFCLAINHEVLSFIEKHENKLNFKAPQASVLIVDDNEMNRKVALGLLEPLGMAMDIAVDGKQAIDKVKNNKFDIILMDHMMPVMDGVEATQAIRALDDDYYKNVPIIALSANALSEAREQFKAVGMNDFLAKPVKSKDLFRIIKEYLPGEKIEVSDETLSFEEINEEALPIIEGLDVKAGVENSGGLKLFISLLGDFYKLIDRKSIKIEKCLADSLIRDFTIEVHALKNTARMIGALELSDMFYELEKAGNANDVSFIHENIDKTLKLYRSYKPILKEYGESDEEKESVPKEEIIATIEALKIAMDGFDLDGADEAMKKLESFAVPDEIKEAINDLAALVADVAMEEVIELCNSIVNKLS